MLTCLLFAGRTSLVLLPPSPPRSDGFDAAPRVQTITAVQKAIKEEEEEKESEGWSSFSNSDSEATKKFVVKPHLPNKVGSSSEASKREAEDVLEADLVPPLKRKRTIAVKGVDQKFHFA